MNQGHLPLFDSEERSVRYPTWDELQRQCPPGRGKRDLSAIPKMTEAKLRKYYETRAEKNTL